MTETEINELIAAGENKVCEFKRNFNVETIEALVAFANTNGGKVLIGVNDDGDIVGVNLERETAHNWVNEIKSKTTPQLIPDVNLYTIAGKEIVILSIQEYPVKPVAVRGKYYKRVANSNHLMGISEVVNLHLSAFNTSWDFYLNSHFRIDDISLEKVQAVIEMMNARGRNIDDDPMTFLFKNDLVREEHITNAALLLFSVRDTVFTTIELGRFQTEIIIKDSLRTKSDIVTQIGQVVDFVKKHINKEILITGKTQNTEKWQYPIEAVREVVANMIVHRDYSLSSDSVVKVFDDKIEFYNPGRLPENITVEDLISFNYKSVPRNKLIADFFKELGIIEKYGSGIKRIISLCKEYDLPVPKFENISEGFLVTLFARGNRGVTAPILNDTGEDFAESIGAKVPGKVPDRVPGKVPDNLTENQRKILSLLTENSRLSLSELALQIGMSKRKMLVNVNVLKSRGILTRVGTTKSGYWQIIT